MTWTDSLRGKSVSQPQTSNPYAQVYQSRGLFPPEPPSVCTGILMKQLSQAPGRAPSTKPPALFQGHEGAAHWPMGPTLGPTRPSEAKLQESHLPGAQHVHTTGAQSKACFPAPAPSSPALCTKAAVCPDPQLDGADAMC